MHYRSTFLLIATLGAQSVHAVELSASGISVPFFNDAGKLTHKLLAKHGTKVGNVQNLHEVQVHYFSAADSNVVVQKLEAAEATWDNRKETLVGRGSIVVATDENRLTGEGFDFALATSLLHIHRNFTMTNREVVVTSDRAIVELLVEKEGENVKVRDVKRCEAIGNLQIVTQPTATQEYRFDKALSEIAIYDGATQTVTLPKPIRTFSKGREAPTLNKLTINLKKGAAPAATKSSQP